jgi:hypothetical protein
MRKRHVLGSVRKQMYHIRDVIVATDPRVRHPPPQQYYGPTILDSREQVITSLLELKFHFPSHNKHQL